MSEKDLSGKVAFISNQPDGFRQFFSSFLLILIGLPITM